MHARPGLHQSPVGGNFGFIPERQDQIQRRRGRPPNVDPQQCHRRNLVERCAGGLKAARVVAMRFDKFAIHYLGCILLTMIYRYMQLAFSDTA